MPPSRTPRTIVRVEVGRQKSHTQVGITAYKKVPAGTTVEVADGTIMPVDRFGTIGGLVTGSTDLEGPVGPARQKVTISENLLLHNVNVHLGSTDARRRKMSSPAKFSADERGRRRGK